MSPLPFMTIVNELTTQGYSIRRNFFNPEDFAALARELNLLYDGGNFKDAAIGNHKKTSTHGEVRSDKTYWIDPHSPTPTQQIILRAFEKLRVECNQLLFLGLQTFEGHYSVYLKNSSYCRHLDSFQDDDARVLSVVIYFNENWQTGDGGELLLHCQPPVLIEPHAGTLVVFLSQQIEHEVLVAYKTRIGFSGWFKKRRIS